MILIGLSGKIGVGKTALARELCSRSEQALRLSFAAALKQEAATRYGYDPLLNETAAGKETMVQHPDLVGGAASVRQILIAMGQERRAENPEYWCERLRDAVAALALAGMRMAVVDDVRFPNEAALIRRRGGMLVRVEPYDGWKPGPCAHDVSETALDNGVGWDVVARPVFGVEGLRQAANEIMWQWSEIKESQNVA